MSKERNALYISFRSSSVFFCKLAYSTIPIISTRDCSKCSKKPFNCSAGRFTSEINMVWSFKLISSVKFLRSIFFAIFATLTPSISSSPFLCLIFYNAPRSNLRCALWVYAFCNPKYIISLRFHQQNESDDTLLLRPAYS